MTKTEMLNALSAILNSISQNNSKKEEITKSIKYLTFLIDNTELSESEKLQMRWAQDDAYYKIHTDLMEHNARVDKCRR